MFKLPTHLEEYILGVYGLPKLFKKSCKWGCTQLVRELLRYPQLRNYLNRCRNHLEDCFRRACKHGHVDTARLILLNFNLNNVLEYAVKEAVEEDHDGIVRLVLAMKDGPVDVELMSRALEMACFLKRPKTFDLIQRRLVNLNKAPRNLLQIAYFTGCSPLVQELVLSGRGQLCNCCRLQAHKEHYREISNV